MSDLPIRIFVSYSHSDSKYLGEESLLGFLKPLQREGAEFWTDERIGAGDKWDDEIRSRISQTDIALVLVSQTFLDSEYCSVEIAGFLERSRESGLIIFPVILSACEWERHAWLRSTQYLPGSGQTIEEHYVDPGAQKRLFLTIRSNLRVQIDRLRQARKPVPAPAPAPAAKQSMAGERRQVTALACELTVLGGLGELEAEEIVEVLPEFRTRAAEIVEWLGGHVAQRQGRRLLSYFGCPRVHEDDPRRAVIAAREIAALARNLGGGVGSGPVSLAMKLAIHTGVMVVSADSDNGEPMLVGEVPEVVAAVVNVTPPGRIYITAPAHDLIEKEYACAAAADVEVKDLGRSLELFVLEVDDAADTPNAGREAPSRKTLVARDHELEILRQCWELVREGDGQVVYIRGEAGLGKSRLIQELRSEVTGTAMTWLECRCSPYHQNTELYPIVDLLQRVLARADPSEKVGPVERLEAVVRDAGMPVETVVPLFLALLSLPPEPRYQPLELSPEGRKKNTLAAVLELIFRLAARQPVLLIVEDLHWIDASTLAFLDLLIQSQATVPVLTLLTFRPEFDPPWRQLSYLSELSLRRLGSKEASALVSLLTDGKAFPPDILAEIVEKADGIPLFAEELTKMVSESERTMVAGEKLAVPATLEGSLIARLDRLDTAKEIAQIASVIGREFVRDLLSQAVSVDEAALVSDLDRLLESEIILRRGLPSEASYLFKHALIQQAAYESVLTRDARQLHGKIAQALESKFPDLAERHPEVVAFHFMRAGNAGKAIDYWQRAAERSIKNSGNPEAVAHLTKCLELLAKLPEGPERDRREMTLRTMLALPLIACKGYTAVEVDEELSRARQLCLDVGGDSELFRVLRLMWSYQTVRGDHAKAFEAAQEIYAMACNHDDRGWRLEADRALGASYLYLGRLNEARHQLEGAIDFYDRKRDHAHVLIYGQDPGVVCLSNASIALWCLGYFDQATARGDEAVSLARELGHPYSLCYSLFFRSLLHMFRRDLDNLEQHSDEIITVSRHQSFPFWETMSSMMKGWASAQRGAAAAGVATMNAWLAGSVKLGAQIFLPTIYCVKAEAHIALGDIEGALAAVEQGLAVRQATGESFFEPELHRLKGDLLLLQTPGSPAAEEHLLRAFESSKTEEGRFLELRAAISLARFWSANGKEEEARDMLEKTRSRFTEGTDTFDLQQADALLAQFAAVRH
jgi:predicted ATPase/class 3 adenylate cyclase